MVLSANYEVWSFPSLIYCSQKGKHYESARRFNIPADVFQHRKTEQVNTYAKSKMLLLMVLFFAMGVDFNDFFVLKIPPRIIVILFNILMLVVFW